ncbi:hypothetical protein PABG_07227 [Paracoccidioides brasiliensis Pb03]|nr:hypothetical protein PABG_07227 [Paracoccidioides brasiliensis Pb03]
MASIKKRRSQNNDVQPQQQKKVKPDSSNSSSKNNSAASAGAERKVDSNGDFYWSLARSRRLTVSSFKGRTMISVREYYEKDGQELPGKKGISLPLEQFNALVQLLPDVEAVIKEKGGSLERPKYAETGAAADREGNETAESEPEKAAEESGPGSDDGSVEG